MEKEKIIESLKTLNSSLPHSCIVLKAARIYLNLKGNEFAKILNISPAALSQIETGKRKPSIKLIEKVCSICHNFIKEDFYSWKL